MKKLLKIIVLLFAIVLVAIGALVGYVRFGLPSVGRAQVMTVKADPERLHRGEYLVNHVMGCFVCHSRRDFTRFSGPVIPGSEGMGGEGFNRTEGFPGAFPPPNLTPAHLKEWTDGEIFRAVTAGVRKDGEPLFPVMPYQMFGQLDEEDIQSVIVFLRSIAPGGRNVEGRAVDFPFSLILRTIPRPAKMSKRPEVTDTVKYGEYLTKAASCLDCHTRMEGNSRRFDEAFSGGFEFRLPDGAIARSANLTPDEETGIGKMSKEQFIGRFKSFAPGTYQPAAVRSGEFNTVMPWTAFGGMTEQDLGAIYDYLRTVKPVNRSNTRYSAPGSVVANQG